MHELSIAMNIIDLVQEEAERLGGRQVCAIHLKLGQFSGVVKEALLNSYELACEQTPLQGTKLVIEEVPIAIYCSTCGARRAVHSTQLLCCAECGTPALEIIEGKEIEVSALELNP
jgi:hydrogenase nickel incorporation protein HypA/HybF